MSSRRSLLLPSLLALLLFTAALLPRESAAQQSELTTVILVRHAEKATHPPADPPLNPRGEQRAQKLAGMLAESGITAIYATDFARTRETAAPLAGRLGLEIREYDPRNAEFHEELLEENEGGRVLVVGHSNTIPALANRLLGEERFAQFEDADYGNLLILSAWAPGEARALRLRF